MEYFLRWPPQYISIIQLVYELAKNLLRKLNVFSAGEKTNKLTPEKSNKASSEDILHFRTSFFYRRRRFAVTSRTTTFTTTTKSNLVKYAGAAAAGWWSKSPSKKPSY